MRGFLLSCNWLRPDTPCRQEFLPRYIPTRNGLLLAVAFEQALRGVRGWGSLLAAYTDNSVYFSMVFFLGNWSAHLHSLRSSPGGSQAGFRKPHFRDALGGLLKVKVRNFSGFYNFVVVSFFFFFFAFHSWKSLVHMPIIYKMRTTWIRHFTSSEVDLYDFEDSRS